MSVTSIASELGGLTYGLVHLALATTAYVDPKSGKDLGVQFQQALGSLPAVPGDTGTNAGFDLGWGPAHNLDYSNLMYVTVYSSGGQPQFAAVGVRGTDIGVADKLGLLKQILEDFDVKDTVPASQINANASAGAVVAKGSYDGLQTLLGLESSALQLARTNYTPPTPSKQMDLLAYLQMMFGPEGVYPNLPIVVTGHSLGGCQTTVLAAYLVGQMTGATIIPHPFAPPTAGNAQFASWYGTTFTSGGMVWMNPLDIVPSAFESLETIKTQLWGAYAWAAAGPKATGPSMPSDLDIPFNKIEKDAAPNNYTQIATNALWMNKVMPTEAEVQAILAAMNMDKSKWETWEAQLIWQHFPPAYYNLMLQVSGVAQPYPLMVPSHF